MCLPFDIILYLHSFVHHEGRTIDLSNIHIKTSVGLNVLGRDINIVIHSDRYGPVPGSPHTVVHGYRDAPVGHLKVLVSEVNGNRSRHVGVRRRVRQ